MGLGFRRNYLRNREVRELADMAFTAQRSAETFREQGLAEWSQTMEDSRDEALHRLTLFVHGRDDEEAS